MIRLRRVYDAPGEDEGGKFLVDRIWPRGIRKEQLQFDSWLKEVAPSPELRRWFSHDPNKWSRFRERYRRELSAPEKDRILDELARQAASGDITLLYAARDPEHTHALVLAELLEEKVRELESRKTP